MEKLDVLKAIYLKGGVTLQSNFARDHSMYIAMLASQGLLTTFDGELYGNKWRVTFEGLLKLTEKGLV